ncbi:MAG: sarcosine oxidase subunit gamma family protein [Pseudomonadota bacterium]
MAYDVQIDRNQPPLVLDLRALPETATDFCHQMGLPLPQATNSQLAEGPWVAMRVGPDHWMFLGENRVEQSLNEMIEGAVARSDLSIIEVSDAYEGFDLSGPEVLEVMAQGTPLDLRPAAFPEEGASFTSFFGRRVVLLRHREPTGFKVLVERSYGDYLKACLETARAGQSKAVDSA